MYCTKRLTFCICVYVCYKVKHGFIDCDSHYYFTPTFLWSRASKYKKYIRKRETDREKEYYIRMNFSPIELYRTVRVGEMEPTRVRMMDVNAR